jgi:hypothetical protein
VYPQHLEGKKDEQSEVFFVHERFVFRPPTGVQAPLTDHNLSMVRSTARRRHFANRTKFFNYIATTCRSTDGVRREWISACVASQEHNEWFLWLSDFRLLFAQSFSRHCSLGHNLQYRRVAQVSTRSSTLNPSGSACGYVRDVDIE